MNDERITLDTNVLVYSIDKDSGIKHKKAIEALNFAVENDTVITLQALSEFYNVVTRKNKIPGELAFNLVNKFQNLFTIISAKTTTLNKAMIATQDHKFSFWDAMLWATAKEAHVDVILSEDFNVGSSIGGIKFINPFEKKQYRKA